MKRKHWLDMRQSGWFDFMVLLLILGAVLLTLGVAGTIQYGAIQKTLGPDASAFELKQAHTLISKGHGSLLLTGGLAAAVALSGFLSLRFLAPIVRADEAQAKSLEAHPYRAAVCSSHPDNAGHAVPHLLDDRLLPEVQRRAAAGCAHIVAPAKLCGKTIPRY